MVNQRKREINWLRILLAFLIASFLFFLGLFLGYITGKFIENSSLGIEEKIKDEISNFETLAAVQKNYPCSVELLNTATDRLGYLTDFIDLMEKQKGKNDANVIRIKKLYSIVESRHMLLLMETENRCNSSYNIVQYFYSNVKECESDLDKVSFILSYAKKKNPDIKVYSFDMNLDSDVVYILKQNYNVSQCYTLVLNSKRVDFDINDASSFEKLLKK